MIMSSPMIATNGIIQNVVTQQSTSLLSSSSSSLFGNSAAIGAAAKAMAELGIAGCIGAFCVQKQMVTPESIRAMSTTSFSILLPCFLGTGIIKTIVTQGGFSMDILGAPMIAITQSFLLFQLCRHLLLPMIGMDKDTTRGRATAVSCAWGNSGVVPLIFSEALFRNQPDILAQCYSAVSLYLVGWSPFFWSFGRSVLVGIGAEEDNKNDDTDNNNTSNDKTIMTTTTTKKTKNGILSSSRMTQTMKTIKRVASPPVKGVLTGMALALSPFGKLLVSATPQQPGSTAALSVVFNSFQNLGRAANPLGLLVLTSSLAMGISQRKSDSNNDIDMKQSSENDTTTTTTTTTNISPKKNVSGLQRWLCVSFARFVVSPPLMWTLLNFYERLGLIASSKTNPVLWFILLLQSCMPPAQNSVLMLQVANNPDEANRLAGFLFSMYATSMIPVIMIVGVMLQAFKLTP